MKHKNIKYYPEGITFVAIMILILGLGWLTASKALLIDQNPVKEEAAQPNPKTSQQILKIGTTQIMTEVRRTEAEQELGLSWRSSMAPNEGMIFVYTSPQKVLYWMKGMQFPLDFIFGTHNKVVDIVKNIPEPSTAHPVVRTVSPQVDVDMVIEVNAGWVASHQIKVGDEIKLQNSNDK